MFPDVDEVQVRSGGGQSPTVVKMPEVATVMVFRTTPERRSDLIVLGPRTRGSYHSGEAPPVCIQLRLRAGQARALFGVPVHELVDRAVPLVDLWGAAARRLTSAVAEAGDDTGLALSRIADAFAARVPEPGNPLLSAAARELTSPSARLSEVAGRVGVSERHLRNLFAREVGLSPKHFARISRLGKVLALAGRREWSAVAEDAGFFDQAHMISDFRALMGVSPTAFLSGRLPAVTPCTALTRSFA